MKGIIINFIQKLGTNFQDSCTFHGRENRNSFNSSSTKGLRGVHFKVNMHLYSLYSTIYSLGSSGLTAIYVGNQYIALCPYGDKGYIKIGSKNGSREGENLKTAGSQQKDLGGRTRDTKYKDLKDLGEFKGLQFYLRKHLREGMKGAEREASQDICKGVFLPVWAALVRPTYALAPTFSRHFLSRTFPAFVLLSVYYGYYVRVVVLSGFGGWIGMELT